MTESLVVAFGGNAIAPSGGRGTAEEQRANVRRMSEQMARLVRAGHKVVITHGNGPQVGEIMLKSEMARDVVPLITLDVAGSMSQGQLGYLLQQEIGNILAADGFTHTVCAVVTQVVVSADDPAFSLPTKPIGRFYSKQEALSAGAERGWHMVEDAGRGYRRVVPSPQPLRIVEWPAIKCLVDAGALVIAAGGGGIPVVLESDGTLRGVEAVIDKDLASERLASLVGVDTLALLTEVETVYLDFGAPAQRPLGVVNADELERHHADGQFPPGSMGPKVKAALQFLRAGGKRVIITSPDRLVDAVESKTVGTQILAGQAIVPSLATAETVA